MNNPRLTLNLNQRIHFELTPAGKKKWAELAQKEQERYNLPNRVMRKTPEGPTSTSLWDFMSFFGEVFTLGSPLYIVDNDIQLEQLT